MEIYVYGLILAGYLVLIFLSREEQGDPAERMARYIYRKSHGWIRKNKGFRIWDESTVRRELSLLNPLGKTQKQVEQFYVGRIRLILLILLAGDVLAAASYAAAGQNMLLREGDRLIRDEIGGEDRDAELEVYLAPEGTGNPEKQETKGTRQGSYQLQVRSRKYNRAELDKLSDSLFDRLPGMILGENKDLSHVTKNLILPAEAEGFPFRITWESSSYALVDADGTIGNLGMKGNEREKVILSAILLYDDGTAEGFRREKEYPVTVIPPAMTEQERMAEKIRESILRSDEESAADAEFPLPQEVENRRLFWEERPADAGLSILLFAGIVAVLAAAVMRSRLHEKVERRERQMLLDYPQIISKFVLYLGAGLSIRSTFTRLGEAYQKGREEGKEERGAYEEILRVCRELSSGVPETEAYARFGQRCRSRQYARLSTLLTQNLRKGNQELLSVIQQEAQASYEERRNMARKLGEEAETKLLLPMIMMLTITMLIIIIPAYYSFAM